MWIECLSTEAFVREVGSALKADSPDDAAHRIHRRWQPHELCQFLDHGAVHIRKLACVALSLVGDPSTVACLTQALKDDDPQVNEFAENALWSVWFRMGDRRAMGPFKRGLAAMERGAPEDAVSWLERARTVDPSFVEAFHQCALAHWMTGDCAAALADCREALDRMPVHFGAMATMGHCRAERGELRGAARCYRRALQINPRMDAVAAALARMDRCLGLTDPTGPTDSPTVQA